MTLFVIHHDHPHAYLRAFVDGRLVAEALIKAGVIPAPQKEEK